MVRPFIFPALTIWGTEARWCCAFPGGSLFSLHRPSGVLELRQRVRLTGRLLSLHRKAGVRELR